MTELPRQSLPSASAWSVLLVVAVFAVYWPGMHGGFVFDDAPNIVENTHLHVTTLRWADWWGALFSSPSSDIGRPLASFSFALNYYLTGLDPWWMKLTNIAIHAINSVLAYGLARAILARVDYASSSTTRSQVMSLFIAAAWALHPINLMAVLYVVQRMESLSHLFVFASLWTYVYLRRPDAPTRAIWLAGLVLVIGTLAGALAKESAVLTTLYGLCLEITVLRTADPAPRRRLASMYAIILFLPALLAAGVLLRRSLSPYAFSGRNFDMGQRLLTEARVVMDYLQWIIAPSLRKLGLYHDDYPISTGLLTPWSTAACLAAIGALIAVAWRLRQRRPLLSLGLAWFLSAQALTATFLPLELVFEHRNYFASLGIVLVAADLLMLLDRPAARVRRAACLGVAIVGLLAGFTFLRAKEWETPLRFVQSEAAKNPTSSRATYELARLLVILTAYDRNSPYDGPAMAAIENARRVPGTNLLATQAALIFAARTGRPLQAAWWQDLNDKLEHQPLGPATFAALRALVECSNRRECPFPPDRMLAAFGAAMAHGEHPELLNLYGNYVLNSLHDPNLALKAWRAAVDAAPSQTQYRANLARLLIAAGQLEAATEQIMGIRASGNLGQYRSLADSLDRLVEARRGRPNAQQ